MHIKVARGPSLTIGVFKGSMIQQFSASPLVSSTSHFPLKSFQRVGAFPAATYYDGVIIPIVGLIYLKDKLNVSEEKSAGSL